MTTRGGGGGCCGGAGRRTALGGGPAHGKFVVRGATPLVEHIAGGVLRRGRKGNSLGLRAEKCFGQLLISEG